MGMREFGLLVKHNREMRNLSTMDLAYSMGKVQSWVSDLESGRIKHAPTPEQLHKLADLLDLTDADLLAAMGYCVHEEDDPIAQLPLIDRDILNGVIRLDDGEKAQVLSLIRFLGERRTAGASVRKVG